MLGGFNYYYFFFSNNMFPQYVFFFFESSTSLLTYASGIYIRSEIIEGWKMNLNLENEGCVENA